MLAPYKLGQSIKASLLNSFDVNIAAGSVYPVEMLCSIMG
jgi:hypothetical protein